MTHLDERIRGNMRMRELAVPLQALLSVLTCSGLMWMVYTMAFFDPNPPTAAEVHSQETQDPEMLVFRTAAAMTVDALLFGPTQILLPVTGPTSTPMPSSTSRSGLSTLIVLATQTGTPTAALGPSSTARSDGGPGLIPATATVRTPTLPPTAAPTMTATPQPTATSAPTIQPSPTDTLPPDPTEIVPTATEPQATTPAPTEPPPTDPPTAEPTIAEPPTQQALAPTSEVAP